MQLFVNARLAASIISQHLTDDPVLLYLQASRRLPALGRLAGRLLRLVFPESSIAAPVVLAALSLGDSSDVRRRLQLAVDRRVSGLRARRLADIADASGLTELADALLTAAENESGVQSTLARRLWSEGKLSRAVSVLDGSGPAGSRQQNRLRGELAVYAGAAPRLKPQEFKAVSGRVLFLLTNSLPHTASGYAQRSHSIMVAQQQAGWDVLAVTRLAYPVQVGKFLAQASDVVGGVRYRRLLPGRLAATMDARLQQQAEELLKVALEFKPSVLHTTTHFVNGLVVRAVADALGIPWVYEVRGQLADTWAATRGPEARGSEKYRLFQEREAEVMRDADLVVTLGQVMKSNIMAAGVSESKISLAPNAVGGAFLEEPLRPADARRRLGLPEDGLYIGTVSSLVAYEGLDDLVAAFALLSPDFPTLRLLIVGDGVSRPGLQQQIHALGLSDRTIFTGRVPGDRTPLYHQALDVFVVPRKDLDVTRAVTPLKPVEALASARPVIGSDLPALREIIDDGGNGLLVPAESPGQLAEAIAALLSAPDRRALMGDAGRSMVLAERTWAANALTLAARYSGLHQ